jgi:hypothetical protein
MVTIEEVEISPNGAPIHSSILIYYMENPVIPSFLVRVENALKCHSDG